MLKHQEERTYYENVFIIVWERWHYAIIRISEGDYSCHVTAGEAWWPSQADQ